MYVHVICILKRMFNKWIIMSDIIDHLSFMIGNMYCFYKVNCLCKIECEKEFVEHVFVVVQNYSFGYL